MFVFKSLDIIRGGLTKAVLNRANTLAEYNNEVIFLTLAFQPRFDSIIKELHKSGSLDKRIKVINFFNDILKLDKSKRKSSKDVVEEKGFYVFKDENQSKPSYRYYKDGLYVKYKRYNKSGDLLFVDYMNESRHRYQRDEFNNKGAIIRSRQMDLFSNKPRLDSYYDNSGHCAITIWIDDKGKEGRTLFFDKRNPKEYSKLDDFYKAWVEQKLSKLSSPVVISDSRKTDDIVAKISSNKVKKVAVLHNNHFKSPYDHTAGIKKSWDPFFNNINLFNRIVFLTEEQKEDVENKFGKLKSAVVIPHAVPKTEKQKNENKVEVNPNLVVTLARYKKQKRLDEAIKAFSYVVKEIPDAKYHIYGFGDLQGELESLIKKLNLTNNVKLLGFTSDAIKTYKSAACSVLTSDFEGFGLVLTESLAAGTPVVSYDIKYGPKDIIRQGIDGYLVPKGDQKGMADKIIALLKNSKLRDELSNNATQVAKRFSIEKYETSWKNLIENI